MKADLIASSNASQTVSLGEGWYPIARSYDVNKKPLRVEFFNKAFVLYRVTTEVVAFPDQCPHRGYPLSEGKLIDGEIRCPYHGWRFNVKGHLTDLPGKINFKSRAKPALNPAVVIEQYDFIWMRYGRDGSATKEPKVTSVHKTADYFTVADSINANAVDILENFLDPLHTHFVHPGIIRSKASPRNLCEVIIRNCAQGYEAVYTEEKPQSGLLSKFFGKHITHSVGRIVHPGFVEIEYHSQYGVELSVVVYLHETKAGKHRIFIRVYYKKTALPFLLKLCAMFPFQWLTYRQDKNVLEKLQQNRDENFVSRVTDVDILRRCIENVLSNQMGDVDEKKNILL